MIYRVTIDSWMPTSLNAIGVNCWQKNARLKKEDAEVIARAFYSSGVRFARVPASVAKARKRVKLIGRQPGDPAPVRRRVMLEVTLAKGVRARDQDNLGKSLLDGLKRCGYLYDDSPKWCELILPFLYVRGDRTSTTIILEDLPAYAMAKIVKGEVA